MRFGDDFLSTDPDHLAQKAFTACRRSKRAHPNRTKNAWSAFMAARAPTGTDPE